MLFDNSDANICSVVATLVKGRTDREGGGRKIGEKIQREKKKMWNRMILSLASGPPETDIGAAAVDLHLFDALCVPEVFHSPMKIPIHPSFHPIFKLCLSISQSL